MNVKYTNKHLKRQITDNLCMVPVIIGLFVLAVFLCFLSFYNTHKDISKERQLYLGDLAGIIDNTVYRVELTEMPEEVYPHYYMVKVGDIAFMTSHLGDALTEFKETGHAQLRGVLRAFTQSKHEAEEAALAYFEDNDYYTDNSNMQARVAKHYFDCTKIGFYDKLIDEHPIGLVFGITFMFLALLGLHWENGFFAKLRYYRPAFGSVRYTAEEIDTQANMPGSEWLSSYDIYVTPKILIGTNRGIAVVGYDDIAEVYVKAKEHSEAIPGSKHYNYSVKKFVYKHKDYNTYQLIVRTKNNKRLLLSESRSAGSFLPLKKVIDERCGPAVWNIE